MQGTTYSTPQNFLDDKSDMNIFEEVIDLLLVDAYIPEERLKKIDLSDKREFIFNYVIDNISESGDKAVSILNKISELSIDTPIVERFKTSLTALNEAWAWYRTLSDIEKDYIRKIQESSIAIG